MTPTTTSTLINTPTTTPITTTTNTTSSSSYEDGEIIPLPQQHEQREWTRSMFPPYPLDTPVSTTSFSISFSSSLEYYQHVKRRGASNTLHILTHVLAHHAHAHDDAKHVSPNVMPSQHIIDIQDISRVYFSLPRSQQQQTDQKTQQIQPQQHTQQKHKQQTQPQQLQYKLYVYCISAEAAQRVRGAITSKTTLKCDNARERVIIGQVSSINFRLPTSFIMGHIKSHVPQITSLTITRVRHNYPSTHYKDYCYFSIYASEIKYLYLIPPLPGSHVPLSWYKFIPPIVKMCTFCYSKEHTRSKCLLKHVSVVICSTCGQQGHMARTCKQQHPKCLCCKSMLHNVLSCPQYVPQYKKLDTCPPPSEFPPLSPSSSNFRSPISSPLSDSSNNTSPSHDDIHLSRHAKRARHTSFDETASIYSYELEQEIDLPPKSPQQNNNITRSSSVQSIRSVTPSSHRRSSSSVSSSSSSIKEMQMEKMIEEQEKRIQLQQQQIHEQTNMIAELQKQLQAISLQLQQLTITRQTNTQTTTNNTSTSSNHMHD